MQLDWDGFKLDQVGFKVDWDGFKLDQDGFKLDWDGFMLDQDGFKLDWDGFKLDWDGFKLDQDRSYWVSMEIFCIAELGMLQFCLTLRQCDNDRLKYKKLSFLHLIQR